MFEFIIGNVVSIEEDYIVLENNKIGYKIMTSYNTISQLGLGEKDVMIYTQLIPREDGIFLYGFTRMEEMEMFRLLLLVSRIGPKVALGILSSMTPGDIKHAILNKNYKELCKAPGIGKKTAERIILELKDRVGDLQTISSEPQLRLVDKTEEAIEGLIGLGYTRYELERVISKIDTEGMEVEEIIRATLRAMSQK